MKTRSLAFALPMLLLAGMGSNIGPFTTGANGYIGGSSPIHIPRRTKFKGWMREKRRSTFNKTK